MYKSVDLMRAGYDLYNNYFGEESNSMSREDQRFFNRLYSSNFADRVEERRYEKKKIVRHEERFSYGPFTVEIIVEYTKSNDRFKRYYYEDYCVYYDGELRHQGGREEALEQLLGAIKEFVNANNRAALQAAYQAAVEEEQRRIAYWRSLPPEVTASDRIS